MKLGLKIAKNVTSNYLGVFFISLINFFLLPYIVHRIGDSANGAWTLIGSVLGYFALLDLGIAGTLVKYVAKFNAEGKEDEINDLFNTGFFLYLLIGLFVFIGVIILSFFINKIFNIPPELVFATRIAFMLMGINLLATFAASPLTGIFGGYQKYEIVNFFNVVQTGLFGLLIVLFLSYFKNGIIFIATISLIINVSMILVRYLYIKRKYKFIKLGVKHFKKDIVKLIFSFSVWLFILNIGIYIVFYTDNVVIGALGTTAMITLYQVGLKPNNFLRTISGQLLAVIMPVASELEAAKNFEKLKRMFLEATRITFIIVVPFVLMTIFFGKTLIKVWMGYEYLSAFPVLVVLAVASLFTSVQGAASQILIGLGRHKALAIVSIIEATANLTLSIILIRKIGILGVAIGTTLPTVLIALFFVMPFACRSIKVSFFELLGKILVPVLLSLFFTAGLYILRNLNIFNNIWILILFGGFVFLTFILANYIFMRSEEKRVYINIWQAAAEKLK